MSSQDYSSQTKYKFHPDMNNTYADYYNFKSSYNKMVPLRLPWQVLSLSTTWSRWRIVGRQVIDSLSLRLQLHHHSHHWPTRHGFGGLRFPAWPLEGNG